MCEISCCTSSGAAVKCHFTPTMSLRRPMPLGQSAAEKSENPPTMKLHPVYASLAGFCMIAIGLCLVRYAYTPLIPSLIDAEWVTKAGAGYVSGFNCLGYLLGCVAALFLPHRVGVRLLLRASLIVALVGQVMSALTGHWQLWAFGLALTRCQLLPAVCNRPGHFGHRAAAFGVAALSPQAWTGRGLTIPWSAGRDRGVPKRLSETRG
jgi:MFS family permease